MVVAIVKGSMGNHETTVNACYMVPVAPTLDLALAFQERHWDLGAYLCFLQLQSWAEETPDLPTELVIPVSEAAADRLFGAPRAFASNRLEVVNDTRKCHKSIDKQRCP